MANAFKNPVVLDTFTSAIDVGDTMFGDSQAKFKLNFIEWQTPSTTTHTAVVTDGDGNSLFSETCTTAAQSIIKYFEGQIVSGLKIAQSGVDSGKIVIAYF